MSLEGVRAAQQRAGIFIDGKVNTPACNCGPDCEMPCWQRVGIADACKGCGCPPFEGDEGL